MDPTEAYVISALIAGIGALWHHVVTNIKDLRDRTEQCEKDRSAIHEQLEVHGEQLAVFRSCSADPCPARDGLRRAESFNLKPNVP